MTEFEKELVRFVSGYLDAGVSAEDYVKAFSQRLLDSIGRQSKPKVSEGLEEEIQSFASRFYHETGNLPLVSDIARHFAQWQKEKFMKGSVEAVFLNTPYPTICLDDCEDYNFKDNQKVHIIFVKED